jgi:hypothetical protein
MDRRVSLMLQNFVSIYVYRALAISVVCRKINSTGTWRKSEMFDVMRDVTLREPI